MFTVKLQVVTDGKNGKMTKEEYLQTEKLEKIVKPNQITLRCWSETSTVTEYELAENAYNIAFIMNNEGRTVEVIRAPITK